MLNKISIEILEFIKENESFFIDRWVPSVHIKKSLDLNFISVPKDNKQYGEKGWLFAIMARILEDQGLVKYRKIGNRAFYKSV